MKDFQIGGDCLERFKQVLKDNAITDNFDYLDTLKQPDPILMAQYATAQLKREGHNTDTNHHIITPLYLRDADISLPKNAPRKLAK